MSAFDLSKKILIVDDDADVLEALSGILEAAGYRVNRAAHALAAVCAVVRKDPPDLILADIRMPIMDGLSLVSELKTHRDSRHIPVVAITGFDSPETRAAADAAGYDGYIPKPIDARRFPKQVARFFSAPKETPTPRRRVAAKKRRVPQRLGAGKN